MAQRQPLPQRYLRALSPQTSSPQPSKPPVLRCHLEAWPGSERGPWGREAGTGP